MKKKYLDFKQPEFLLAELPIKDGTYNDNRVWIYHRPSLTLIEFVLVNEFEDFEFQGTQELFLYEDEEWFAVVVQDNTELTGKDIRQVLQGAWKFFEAYLKWEDDQND